MKIRAAMAIISCFVSCLFAVSTVADEIGFLSPIVGSNPGVTIAGVKSGGAPWVVSRGFAVLNDEGRLRVDLRGLILPSVELPGQSQQLPQALSAETQWLRRLIPYYSVSMATPRSVQNCRSRLRALVRSC
jgi:hypothetical protein